MPISLEVLKKYKENKNIFIETGTYTGQTVKKAVDLGFKEIYTIELSSHYYNQAVTNFAPFKHVHPILGDTIVELPKLLKGINESCVFWLDGHYSCGNTALGPEPFPLYFELDEIAKHNIKNHTILIDDVRLMGKLWKKVFLDVVKEKLSKINKKYNLKFEMGFAANDILVAHV